MANHHALQASNWGLEIEEHRVNTTSQSISMAPHDNRLGDRRTQNTFQTDFAESQEELVTDVMPSSQAAHDALATLQTTLAHHLQDDELVWPLSMPPKISSEEEMWLASTFERPWYTHYRDILKERYGLYRHIQTGVHVGYSPKDELVALYQTRHSDQNVSRETLIFQQAQTVVGYQWLLTYLFGMAPYNWQEPQGTPQRSIRTSSAGFANLPQVKVPYTTLADHIAAIQQHIQQGDLYAESEFYGPVRFKPYPGQAFEHMDRDGVAYMEIRLLDVDPFEETGVNMTALHVLEVLLLLPLLADWTIPEQAREWQENVATQDPTTPLSQEQQVAAQQVLVQMANLAEELPPAYQESIAWAQNALSDVHQTKGAQLLAFGDEDTLLDWAFKQAQLHHDNRLKGTTLM